MAGPSFLEQVGFAGLSGTDITTVPWPRDDVAQGRGTTTAAMVLAQLVAAPVAPVGVPAARIGGTIAVVEETRIVRYQTTRDLSISRVLWNGKIGAVVEDPDHSQVFVDLHRTEAVVELSNGRLIHLCGVPEGLRFEELALPVRQLVDVPSPPREATAGIADPWLAEDVRFHLSLGDAWHNAVAAGVFLRLRSIERGSVPKRFTVASSWPHRWMRSLSADQQATVSARAVARVDGLWGEMEGLQEALDPEDEDWRAVLVRWCRERDQLEGVRVLLNWARSGRHLENVLGPFDVAAERFVRSLPIAFHVDDEHLRRAALVSPMSWWVRLERTGAHA
jgi:hypothetical protein